MSYPFAVEESLTAFGSNLKTARLRRRLPQSIIAERAGISLNTLTKIENGDPGVAIGKIASVVFALGLSTPFSEFLCPSEDETAWLSDCERLPQRIRLKNSQR